MKIALVVPGGVDRSGEYRVIPALLALIKRLARRHEVHVFALWQEPQPSEWELLGARVHNIGSGHTQRRAVAAILRENRAGRFKVIHAIWAGPCGLAAVLAARFLHIPALVHIAGGELVALPDIVYGGCLRWYGRLREWTVLRGATVVTAASMPMINMAAQFGVKARRVPLGVDLEAWPPREPTDYDLSVPARLLHVASLNKVKDQQTLLRAMAQLASSGRNFTLDIVGEDTLHGSMHRLTRELQLERYVTFHGFRVQSEMRLLMEAAQLLLVSSRHEAGPMVMLEAAVAGVPTVGTAVGHLTEWAPSAARCVEIADPSALCDAVQELLDDNVARMKIAQAAFRRAVTEDADHTAAQFQSIYEETVC